MSVRFDNLGLSENLQKTVTKNGYSDLPRFRHKPFRLFNKEKDLLAAAQTGTGKLQPSYSLCSMRLKKDPTDYQPCSPRVLILTPTRELAAQVAENIEMLKGNLPVRVALAYGGVGINPQKKALAKGTDFLVCHSGTFTRSHWPKNGQAFFNPYSCPGRSRQECWTWVFLPDLKRIMKFLPEDRQTLLFSATFSPEIKNSAFSSLIIRKC